MANINLKKREAHRRIVQAALQQILNDPVVMPNIDCPDLAVSISRVEFGATVREIWIDVFGRYRNCQIATEMSPHERYLRAAEIRGEKTYIDLTDVFIFPEFLNIVAAELQKRLGLLYVPTIRRFCDMGDELAR